MTFQKLARRIIVLSSICIRIRGNRKLCIYFFLSFFGTPVKRRSYSSTIANPLNDRGGSAIKIDGSRRFCDKFLGKPTAGDSW